MPSFLIGISPVHQQSPGQSSGPIDIDLKLEAGLAEIAGDLYVYASLDEARCPNHGCSDKPPESTYASTELREMWSKRRKLTEGGGVCRSEVMRLNTLICERIHYELELTQEAFSSGWALTLPPRTVWDRLRRHRPFIQTAIDSPQSCVIRSRLRNALRRPDLHGNSSSVKDPLVALASWARRGKLFHDVADPLSYVG